MQTGTKISGLAHLALIGWALFGGAFRPEPVPFEVRDVSLVTAQDYADALRAYQPPETVAEPAALSPPEPTEPAPQVDPTQEAAPEQARPEESPAPPEEALPERLPEPVPPQAEVQEAVPSLVTPDTPPAPEAQRSAGVRPRLPNAPPGGSGEQVVGQRCAARCFR